MQINHNVINVLNLFFLSKFTVTASRGVACVFAARKRALVYILEEDEEEVPDTE
jgi:anaphase-promoting complex subunit 4